MCPSKIPKKCEACKKALKKREEILNNSESVFDAAYDFAIFIKNCCKKCKITENN